MAGVLLELYVSGSDRGAVTEEAGSAEDVRRAASPAGLPVTHVLEMVETDA